MLLVPGICGTVLNVKAKGAKGVGRRAWVSIEYADAAYKQLWGRYNHDTGVMECLHEDLEVVVPHEDKDGGLYPVDILDPEVLIPMAILNYYHSFIWAFRQCGYKPGASLFGFGYDFRQSNLSHCAALLAKLRQVSAAAGGRKVDVVTHSMGGLLMRSLLATHPGPCVELINTWVAIACPFNGAPGFVMDALLTGVEFATGWQEYFFVERSTVHQMCAQAPSVHELFPPRDFTWPQAPPTATLWLKPRAGAPPEQRCYSLSDFRQLMELVLEGNKVTVGKESFDLPLNKGCWEQADRMHKLWATVKLPPSIRMYNIYGTGTPTAYDVTYGSSSTPLAKPADVMVQLASYSRVDGDGVVPSVSAREDHLPAIERVGIEARHRGLLNHPHTWDCVYKWLTGKDGGFRRRPTALAKLGWQMGPDGCSAAGGAAAGGGMGVTGGKAVISARPAEADDDWVVVSQTAWPQPDKQPADSTIL